MGGAPRLPVPICRRSMILRTRAIVRALLHADSACSQIRTTIQPRARSARFTKRSRALLRLIFFSQNTRDDFGCLKCFGHACQKHPSTKTASRNFGKIKSGRPGRFTCRRQPAILWRRNKRIRRISVALLPRPRIAAITSDRFYTVNTSVI